MGVIRTTYQLGAHSPFSTCSNKCFSGFGSINSTECEFLFFSGRMYFHSSLSQRLNSSILRISTPAFYFHPIFLGEEPILTIIFFGWLVQPWTNIFLEDFTRYDPIEQIFWANLGVVSTNQWNYLEDFHTPPFCVSPTNSGHPRCEACNFQMLHQVSGLEFSTGEKTDPQKSEKKTKTVGC